MPKFLLEGDFSVIFEAADDDEASSHLRTVVASLAESMEEKSEDGDGHIGAGLTLLGRYTRPLTIADIDEPFNPKSK